MIHNWLIRTFIQEANISLCPCVGILLIIEILLLILIILLLIIEKKTLLLIQQGLSSCPYFESPVQSLVTLQAWEGTSHMASTPNHMECACAASTLTQTVSSGTSIYNPTGVRLRHPWYAYKRVPYLPALSAMIPSKLHQCFFNCSCTCLLKLFKPRLQLLLCFIQICRRCSKNVRVAEEVELVKVNWLSVFLSGCSVIPHRASRVK